MPKRWAEYLSGFLTVRIIGDYPERIINRATSRGIFLWDLRRREQGVEAKVRLTGYKALSHLLDPDHEIEVTEKSGLPFWRQQVASRAMLAGGALLFVFLLYFLSSLVWNVEIRGNRIVSRGEIAACAAANGLYEGAFKWNFSKDRVANELLKRFPAISFAEVNVKGVTTTITVVEKTLPPVEVTGPCHIVAAKDGVITEILPLEGQALVKVGDAVGAGDILISGVVFPEPDYNGTQKPPYTVHARGQVKARVWYEGYGEWPLSVPYWQETGRSGYRLLMKTARGEKTLLKWGNQKLKTVNKTRFRWSLPLPGGRRLYLVTSREEIRKIRTYSQEAATEKAKERAYSELKGLIKSGEKVLGTRWEMVSTPAENLIRMKATLEVEENIGKAEPIVVKDEPR